MDFFRQQIRRLPEELRIELPPGDFTSIANYIKELEREERNDGLVKIQKEQSEILKKQTKFNLMLVLASTVIAIGGFLNISLSLINNPLDFSKIISSFPEWSSIIILLGIMSFGILLLVMGVLIVTLINHILSKDK